MGKKVCVEIEYTRIMEKEIELPEGKTLDDIHQVQNNGQNNWVLLLKIEEIGGNP